jgi:hypothetical protein
MVNVAVGYGDYLYGQAGAGYFLGDAKYFVPRIDDQSLIRFLASQDVTVGLIRADNELSQHFSNLLTISPSPWSPPARGGGTNYIGKMIRRDFVRGLIGKNKREEGLVKRA